jgi:phospholipid-transporting ATPase
MEVVKFQQSQLINADLDMYYAPSDTPALCRTSALVEELGQIEFVFSDKTGTLTRNEMEFKKCSVAGVAYADVAEEGGDDGEGTKTFEELRGVLYGDPEGQVSTAAIGDREAEAAREFMTLLAVCHTVIPEVRDGKTRYQASSPDEAALVAGAEILGYQFHVSRFFLVIFNIVPDPFHLPSHCILILVQTRKPRSVFISINNVPVEYEVLNICEFNSTRKRMSTVVRTPTGSIKLYCKGADTVIVERLAKSQPYTQKTLVHLEVRSFSFAVLLVSVVITSPTHRNMQPKDCARFAWPTAMSRRLSTASGPPYMSRRLQPSTGVRRPSTVLRS